MMVHIQKNGEFLGPYSLEAARDYLSTGRLTTADLARLEGTSEWIPLTSVSGISESPPTIGGGLPRTDAGRLYKAGGPTQFRTVVRDVAIICAFAGLLGFILGATLGNWEEAIAVAAVANPLLLTIGLVIVGVRAEGNRWRHLGYVTFGLWLVSLINVASGHASFSDWFLGVFILACMMGVSGALSYVFKRSD